jgi:hypothetical protein
VQAADPENAAAYRLAIDGADTGWRHAQSLQAEELVYSWIAAEPDTYAIVGQVRDQEGTIGESRHLLAVAEPTATLTPEPTLTPASMLAPTVTHTATATPLALSPLALPTATLLAGAITYTGWITLPTYPVEPYLVEAYDAIYQWPYLRFDRERYLTDAPHALLRTYETVVLENRYLRLTILPALGGRIWQVENKLTGDSLFYQNPVVKPSPWGPPDQLGWLALGGMEWSLPVIEHGYAWGTPWLVTTSIQADGTAVAEISAPHTMGTGTMGTGTMGTGTIATATQPLLDLHITVTLPPAAAYFDIEPMLQNRADRALAFDYWHNAMLAPGRGNHPSASLRFVLPGSEVVVHSTGDPTLPQQRELLTWPAYQGRDLSKLGNWNQYLGFFEYPRAQGPFVGVYDPAYDAGIVRIFPPEIAKGSKVFGLGWGDAIGSDYFTDNYSAYVELHSGLSPSFFEQTQLPAGGSVRWRERWYPIYGIGGFVAANEQAALAINLPATRPIVVAGLYFNAPFTGELRLLVEGKIVERRPVTGSPEQPLRRLELALPATEPAATELEIQLADAGGTTVISYRINRK